MYELQINNSFSYGHSTISGDSIDEIKNKLKDLYIEKEATVKLYEKKEIPISSEWYETFDHIKHPIRQGYDHSFLYEHAYIFKDWTEN